MTVQAALGFFQHVRERPDLQARIAAWGLTATTTQLLDLARSEGFACSEADLQAAFRHDWVMRSLGQRQSAASARDSDKVG